VCDFVFTRFASSGVGAGDAAAFPSKVFKANLGKIKVNWAKFG